MYQDVLDNVISKCMGMGGQFVEVQKDVESSLWLVLVKDAENNVYGGYTLGEDNKGFLYDLIELCYDKGFALVVNLDKAEA